MVSKDREGGWREKGVDLGWLLCACTCTYICIHVCVYIRTCMCVCICTYACVCTCTYACVCVHECVFMCICERTALLASRTGGWAVNGDWRICTGKQLV